MRGLLIKDFYTLITVLKMYIIIIIVLTIVPIFDQTGFGMIYAAMIPVSLLAYDERSKWNIMADMMPYTKKDIVLSKYIVGYTILGGALLINIIRAAVNVICFNVFFADEVTQLLIIMMIATIYMSVNLPIIFKMGTEAGRRVFLILSGSSFAAVIFGAGRGVNALYDSVLKGVEFNPVFTFGSCIALTVLINIVSIYITIKIKK